MFLKIPTKYILEEVEILGPSFWTQEELDEMKVLPDFYSWSNLGYYIKVEIYDIDDQEFSSD